MSVDKSRSTGNPNKKKSPMDVDDDDRTVSSSGSGKNGHEMAEINVKWCLTGISDVTTAKNVLIHILATIIHSFTDDVTIIDHKAREFTNPDGYATIKSIEAEIHTAKLPIHKAKTKNERQLNRWYATHTIRTSQSISTIKNHFVVNELLRQQKAYVTIHQFNIKDWDIAHLGFLQRHNVLHITKNQTKIKINNMMHEIEGNHPQIELANTRVKSGQKAILSHMTQAYEIQCKRDDSTKILKLLKSGKFRQTMDFVPYAYKKHKPEAFLQAIQNQNKCLTETWILKISGFTNEAIKNCQQLLLEHEGAIEIIPSNNYQITGDWKILVNRRNITKYYKWLQTHLPRIVSAIPDHIQIPENYPAYHINSNPPTNHQDTEQEDDDSYDTMFSNAMTETTNQSPTTYEIPEELYTPTIHPTESSQPPTHISDISSDKTTWAQRAQPSQSYYPQQTPTRNQHQTNKNIKNNPKVALPKEVHVDNSTHTDLHQAMANLQSKTLEEMQILSDQNTTLQKENHDLKHELQRLSTRMEAIFTMLQDQKTHHDTLPPNKRANTMPTPTKRRNPNNLMQDASQHNTGLEAPTKPPDRDSEHLDDQT